jgi:putative Holliday junction resolvase
VGRILGLDVGERRIGVAISTPEETLAVPLRIIERSDRTSDMEAIAAIARAEGADALVVGLPRSLDGSVGKQARRVESFARDASAACALPLELQDERLTSVEAERGGRGRPTRGREPKDDLAAAIILQRYLDRRAGTTQPPSA